MGDQRLGWEGSWLQSRPITCEQWTAGPHEMFGPSSLGLLYGCETGNTSNLEKETVLPRGPSLSLTYSRDLTLWDIRDGLNLRLI